MTRIKIGDDRWVRCPKCGHKLFKAIAGQEITIEIKCHSCREISELIISEEVKKNDNWRGDRRVLEDRIFYR